MNLTAKLKGYLIGEKLAQNDAPDSDLRGAVGAALATGKLTVEKFQELSAPEGEENASALTKQLSDIGKNIQDLTALLAKDQTKQEEGKEEGKKEVELEDDEGGQDVKSVKKTDKQKDLPLWVAKAFARIGGEDEHTSRVEVKGAWEGYRTTKSALVYPELTGKKTPHVFAGQPVSEFGRSLESSSDLDKACAGVWAKFQILSSMRGKSTRFGFEALSPHERELLCYMAEEMEWDNSRDNKQSTRKGFPGGHKALIDDSTSGGLEAAPIVFDDMVIQAPLLFGELYPMVNTVALDRGRRVEGVATEVVTGAWGGVDDTSITLFSTASYVTAFDTTIFRWQGAVQIGLDFLSDSPIDFGAHTTKQYGERLLEDLDDVIAAGNGTTQPEGIINKSGTTSISFGSTTATLGGYEQLMFGVSKQEHSGSYGATAVFCGTEVSYRRARAIAVGTSDARRLGGMDHRSYRWMDTPFKINASLTNAQIFYAILGRYRMYRRRGLTVRTSTEGDTLIRKNELLITVTARYGGQLERGATAAKTTTAEA